MDTAATINRHAGHGRGPAYRLALVGVAVGVVLIVVATLRLAVVVWATPVEIWSREYPPLLDRSIVVDPANERFALWLSSKVADSALIRGLAVTCFSDDTDQAAQDAADTRFDPAACLADIDRALRAAPANGELWTSKASILATQADFGADFLDALRNSYLTARHEGWIAAHRVILGLRLYPLLPADIQADVVGDLNLVLASDQLSAPLVSTYARDSSLRAAAAEPLKALSASQIQRFVGMVRAAAGAP